MINIFSKLENENNLTKSEELVAHYILEHPEEIMDMNVKQLAKKCYVSVNVIYRLCDKLKLGGFSDLKIKISQSYKDFIREKNDIDVNFPIKQYQTKFEILESLKTSYEHTYKKVSSFSSKLLLLYILDALYSCFFELDYDQNLKKKLTYYQSLEYQNK